jgi:hypothetical protein
MLGRRLLLICQTFLSGLAVRGLSLTSPHHDDGIRPLAYGGDMDRLLGGRIFSTRIDRLRSFAYSQGTLSVVYTKSISRSFSHQ